MFGQMLKKAAKESLPVAAEGWLYMAAMLVIGHWGIGGLCVLFLDTPLTDLTTSLLVNFAIWPSIVFLIAFVVDTIEEFRRTRRSQVI
jgi:hypothetical protein